MNCESCDRELPSGQTGLCAPCRYDARWSDEIRALRAENERLRAALRIIATDAMAAYKPPLNHGAALAECGRLYGALQVIAALAESEVRA